jgi:ketosteroid isomerase-like protein
LRLARTAHLSGAQERGAILSPMSHENIDFLRDGYARFNAGEKTAELWFWHPDAEYHAAREDPDSAVHHGIEAIRKQFASWVDAYPDLKIEILEARESGDQVFLWVRFIGHGASSGIPLEMELAHVYTLRDGKPPGWWSSGTATKLLRRQG